MEVFFLQLINIRIIIRLIKKCKYFLVAVLVEKYDSFEGSQVPNQLLSDGSKKPAPSVYCRLLFANIRKDSREIKDTK